MLEETLFSVELPYRSPMEVKAFSFGMDQAGRLLGEGAAPESFADAICFVAGLRGNEVQQTYICGCLVNKLRRLEASGAIVPGKHIMVVPCVNPASMNMGKRFWMGDGTDVNRMMPGYDAGETTQRIADGLFKRVQGFRYGVHFSSFYLEGDFMSHVRVMTGPGIADNHGEEFGLAYVLMHVPGSFDTTTLHYNWRLWDTEAYTLYTKETSQVDEAETEVLVRACLRFMHARGILDYPSHLGFRSSVISEHRLAAIQSPCGGVFRRLVGLGDVISRNQVVAQVVDPLRGEVIAEVPAPRGGVVLYASRQPLVNEQTLLFQIVPRNVNAPGADDRRGNFLDPEA